MIFLKKIDWHEGVRPYLYQLLKNHPPTQKGWTTKNVGNTWSEKNFDDLLSLLQSYGYGWIREKGIRNELENMTLRWDSMYKS